MISSMKILLLLTIVLKMLTVTVSQESCISANFLKHDRASVFTCDFQGINKNDDRIDDEFKCVHFIGLPDAKVCGEVGLRFKINGKENLNNSISVQYFSNIDQQAKLEFIEISGESGWNHWYKTICADFINGMNLYLKSSLTIQLDRILLFIDPLLDSNDNSNPTMSQLPIRIKHNTCNDSLLDINGKHMSVICDPEVKYFGWKVTAIILIILTVGSLILVISLSVTMPYNVWDRPKIEILPVRLSDRVMN